jgi:purine catabolism regulator
VLSQVLGGRLAVLWPLPARAAAATTPVEPPLRLVHLTEELRGHLAGRGGAPVGGGVGRAYPGVRGPARSRQDAEQALWSAWHLFDGQRICNFSDLGIYRLLLPLRAQHPLELRAFYDETLGTLEARAGPEGRNARLLDTLETFLNHGGNIVETARAMSMHRNTLSYRLRRIAEVTGLDLDDPAVRFRAQVALCVRRIIGT